jgi:hypothetical protein
MVAFDAFVCRETYSKIRQALRSLVCRTVDAHWATMKSVFDRVTVEDAQGLLEHCGYTAEMN